MMNCDQIQMYKQETDIKLYTITSRQKRIDSHLALIHFC